MILLYPGCIFKYKLKKLYKNYKDILDNLGIWFTELEYIDCCGQPLRFAGFDREFKEIAIKNSELINKAKIDRIVSLCPQCNRLLEKQYKRDAFLNKEIEVQHITEFLSNKLDSMPMKNIKVTFHDSCFLGRRSGIYEEPRGLLEKLGYSLIEMEYSRENSYCCGAGGNVRQNNPTLANMIAEDRIRQARETKAEFIITTCPSCYVNLYSHGMIVKDISEVVLGH